MEGNMTYQLGENPMVGVKLPIRDAKNKVTGNTKYVADMKFSNMLHAKVLWSPVAHARIRSINTAKAEALSGVHAVICYKNVPRVYFNSSGETIDSYKTEQLFSDVVRYVGDKVAAVAAIDIKTAERALKLIEVDYEELPVNFDPEKALEPGAYVIHDHGDLADGNLIERIVQNAGDVEKGLAEADFIFEDRYTLPAIHHAPIETHASIALYDYNHKLTVYTSSQDTFAVRVNLSRIFDMPMNRVRVSSAPLGGAFGGKVDMILEHVVSALAIKTMRPVKLVLNRREEIVSTRTRHAMIVDAKTGVKRDGSIIAQDYHAICNAGAYASGTSNIVWAMCGKAFKVHKNPNVRFVGEPVITNTVIGGPMRGFGSPQMMFPQQRQMNTIARDLGIDMLDLQRKNLVEPDGVDQRFGDPHGNPRPLDCLEKAAEIFNYREALIEQEAARNESVRIGVGIGVGAHGNGMFGVKPDLTAIIIKMNEDGSLVFYTGTHEMGTSAVTTQAQLIGGVLGVSLERIESVSSDTELTPYQLADYSSRGVFVSAHAAAQCATKMKIELAKYAAELLECDASEVSFADNRAWYGQNSVELSALAFLARTKYDREIIAEMTFASAGLATSYGAHFVKVSVDTQSGQVRILDYVAVHDVGMAINPLSVEGQIEGAIQMGIGYALSEGLIYDDKGRVKNNSFRTYKIPYANQMPDRIRVGFVEEKEPTGPYGAKSIGECSVVPTISAIANAIANAVNREFNHLPITPEKVLKALSVER
jgi:CO/xanthine dehydrogenase Mo-binding subunit